MDAEKSEAARQAFVKRIREELDLTIDTIRTEDGKTVKVLKK